MKAFVLPHTPGPEPPAFRQFPLIDVNPLSGSRKRRMIHNPNMPMRRIHARMITFIRGLKVKMPSSTACGKGQSSLGNVLRHRKEHRRDFRRYLFLADISSAYQAVNLERMTEVLVRAGWMHHLKHDEVRKILHDYFFNHELGGLVTGGPASPDLFNLYCEFTIDQQIRELCKRYRLFYTRYLDDLTFSSLIPIGKKKRRAIRRVVEDAGFKISDKKAKVIDLRKGPATVNGVGICLDGRIFLPRQALRHLTGLMHRACTKGDIDPSVVHGKMGLLKAVTNAGYANKSERRAFDLYRQFRRMHGLALKGPT